MITSPLCDDIISCNFTYQCPRAWNLVIREKFSKFLNFTKLLALQKWLKLAPSVISTDILFWNVMSPVNDEYAISCCTTGLMIKYNNNR